MTTIHDDLVDATIDPVKTKNDHCERTSPGGSTSSSSAVLNPLPITIAESGSDAANASSNMLQNLIENMDTLNLGTYRREYVSNVTTLPNNLGRQLFDVGLRSMLSYQHELAALYFHACVEVCPYMALAHGLLALCHGPNYNFKGEAYYESACHYADVHLEDIQCSFPSQQVADRHSAAAIANIDEIKRQHRGHNKKKNHHSNGAKVKRKTNKGSATSPLNVVNVDDSDPGETPPELISDVEVQLLSAIRILMGTPGVDPDLSDETVGRPYANAMRKVYQKYPNDPDIVYFFAESLLVLNAWQLYEYPSGKPLSPDIEETRDVLERALQVHTQHPGLIHMYVHLSEMSAHPERAYTICEPLRTLLPHAGHLIHMPTHIDVLLGEYDACVRSNLVAIRADMFTMRHSPATAGRESFYFGYIAVCLISGVPCFVSTFIASYNILRHTCAGQHDFHMAIYGSTLGAMEKKGMEIANELNALVNETLFNECPNLAAYLESYSATDIHVMVRFGRWKELLEVEIPADKNLMLYRTASVFYGRALAFAMNGNYVEAKKEADRFDNLRKNHPEASERILHNNSISDLLAVDAVMVRGEIAYREGKCTEGLALLRKAVDLQDNLNFDEPWGKMQPIRHALGGLLLEQGQLSEAEAVFRKDLDFHPRNPWALIGLIRCLEKKSGSTCCSNDGLDDDSSEIFKLKEQYRVQRQNEWADYDVVVPCECCVHPS